MGSANPKTIEMSCHETFIYLPFSEGYQFISRKWNKTTTKWIPYGRKRKRGKPAVRQVDEVIRAVGE